MEESPCDTVEESWPGTIPRMGVKKMFRAGEGKIKKVY